VRSQRGFNSKAAWLHLQEQQKVLKASVAMVWCWLGSEGCMEDRLAVDETAAAAEQPAVACTTVRLLQGWFFVSEFKCGWCN
jgi:hypothetical protein